ncbi:MAG: zinc ribbon domain-containing protein [Candidatus Thermoplasmatota archaeon]|nr:zinc ribbon domain-containing protein [Candidatus Thermoplasmatota archaeon]
MDAKVVKCILCGNVIPPGVTKCPLCGTVVKESTTEKTATEVSSRGLARKFFAEGIPTTSLPPIKSACPMCGFAVDSGVTTCPRCGVPLKGKAEARKTPSEQPPPAPPVSAPPPPIVVPEEPMAVAPPPREPEPPPEPTPVSEPEEPPVRYPRTEKVIPTAAKTSTQGLVNGRGTVVATGLTNGRRATIGTGLVNGTGMSDGTGIEDSVTASGSGRRKTTRRWQLLAIIVALAVVVPAFIYLSYWNGNETTIDGDFEEWAHAAKFGMQAPAALSEVSVEEWAVRSDSDILYLYLKTESDIMGTPNVDSFFLFVDSDGSPDSGYSVSSIGADYLLEIHGWDHKVESASLMRFDSADDQLNWTGWNSIDSLSVAIDAERMEAQARLPVTVTSNFRFFLLAQDNLLNQSSSISYSVPEKGGALVIELEPGPGVDAQTGLIPSASSVSLARLVLTCQGTSGTVESIRPVVVGADLASTIPRISLYPGESRTVDVVVDSSAEPPQSFVSASLGSTRVTSTFTDVVVIGEPVRAYVSSPPPSIQIDGAFGDWAGHTASDGDSEAVANPNINMTAAGSVNTTAFAFFYVSVQGQAFQGAYVPTTRGKPVYQGGGGPLIPHRKTGEDVMRIYIDSDLSNATGKLVQRSAKVIGADYLLEMNGVNGELVSRKLMSYSSGVWTPATATIAAAVYSQQIEVSVTSANIGGATSFAAIVETTDWRVRSDWAWAGSLLDPWVVDASGNTYMSNDGSTWSYLGTPALEPGDRIVDIAVSIGNQGGDIFIVTNTGRTYYWVPEESTEWMVGQTNPIDTATYSEAVSMSFYQNAAAWLLTQNGSYFWLMDAHKNGKQWTYQALAASGVDDFTDLVYSGGTMYALRSGPNTCLSYSNNGNNFVSLTNPTGATSNHAQLTYIPGGPGASDDRLFVLCEKGDIRYSSDGGQTWSALGDLPTPAPGNATIYVGLGIDPTGYMWVVTETGYTFISTDTTTYGNYTCTGQAPIGGIVAIMPTPAIPEFPMLMVPALTMALLLGILRIRGKRT